MRHSRGVWFLAVGSLRPPLCARHVMEQVSMRESVGQTLHARACPSNLHGSVAVESSMFHVGTRGLCSLSIVDGRYLLLSAHVLHSWSKRFSLAPRHAGATQSCCAFACKAQRQAQPIAHFTHALPPLRAVLHACACTCVHMQAPAGGAGGAALPCGAAAAAGGGGGELFHFCVAARLCSLDVTRKH